jgi:crotonobetainyl-CoA:carnitine CoA-transferase CaiB-like acyl-CoA transferase
LEPGILDGVRVVDVAEGIAGSVAALLLAEQGADVVKLEPPSPPPGGNEAGRRTWDRSKRSVSADLTSPPGVQTLHVLLAAADVLIHELSPERAARLEIDDASLARRHPHLIAASILAWPANHPDSERPVDELLAMARLGVCDEQRAMRRSGPVLVRFPLGSWGAVHLATSGIVARLLYKQRTGRVGPAHTSLVQGALVPMGMHWSRAENPSEALAVGMPKETGGSQATLFECADGVWIHLMKCPDPAPLMQKVFAEMGEEGVAAANAAAGVPSFGYPNSGANAVAFRTRPSAEWLADLWANDIPVQPARPFGEVLHDEQARANSYVVELDDPEAGRITVAGLPLTTNPPSRVKSPAPRRGSHTDEVLSGWSPRPVPAVTGPQQRWPLEGVKVLDLGNYLAGPYGPQVLADLGADVIKVESTSGDAMRPTGWAFAGCQRGKRGVALDLKETLTRPALEALVAWADVVHHNVRLPAARRLGIDYDSLRPLNPAMVYCHTSSYGPLGPRSDWPGYDQLFQAQCGWEWLGAGEGNPPMWHRFGFMDHQCALSSVVATLLALYRRQQTGEGQAVAGSLLGAGVLTVSETYLDPSGVLAPYAGLDAAQKRIRPGVEIIEVVGGWIAVAARTPRQLEALCRVAAVDEPAGVAQELAGRDRRSLLVELEAAGVPAEEVREAQKNPFFDDPANRAAGLVASYQSAEFGRFEQPGALWYFGDVGVRLELAPPALGEHTVEVLTEMGFLPEQVEALLASGAARAC